MGVLFSGGQAPGGHNVVTGLFDAIKEWHPESILVGFLGGPKGLIEGKCVHLTKKRLSLFRNQGGFDLLGSGRDKIETEEQMKASLAIAQKEKLNGLVIIGGDDSNTNAAFLANYFKGAGSSCAVVGVPKTIDGDLKNHFIEASFGFDTAVKTFCHTIGSLGRDAVSAAKYTFFVKLMGRSASHVTLASALATQPNLAFIGEEIAAKKLSLQQIVQEVVDWMAMRKELKRPYGVILIPEGLIEFIPEFKTLVKEINRLLAEGSFSLKKLSDPSQALFSSLPTDMQNQLLNERDPHGNVQVSKIETERLLIALVEKKIKIQAQPIFLGYEGRSCPPSNFDATYGTALGYGSALLIAYQATGYMVTLQGLQSPPHEWKMSGTPLTAMMALEERKGKQKPVIQKSLVDLEGSLFREFAEKREGWKKEDAYLDPGPIQY